MTEDYNCNLCGAKYEDEDELNVHKREDHSEFTEMYGKEQDEYSDDQGDFTDKPKAGKYDDRPEVEGEPVSIVGEIDQQEDKPTQSHDDWKKDLDSMRDQYSTEEVLKRATEQEEDREPDEGEPNFDRGKAYGDEEEDNDEPKTVKLNDPPTIGWSDVYGQSPPVEDAKEEGGADDPLKKVADLAESYRFMSRDKRLTLFESLDFGQRDSAILSGLEWNELTRPIKVEASEVYARAQEGIPQPQTARAGTSGQTVHCPTCDRYFSNNEDYETHYKSDHQSQEVETGEDEEEDKAYESLYNIEKYHSSPDYKKKNLICNRCNESFYNGRDRDIHFNEVHATGQEYELPDQCPFCKEIIQEPETLDWHMQEQHGAHVASQFTQTGVQGAMADTDFDALEAFDTDWACPRCGNKNVKTKYEDGLPVGRECPKCGLGKESYAKEVTGDYWWGNHVKWESGMDQDFLYCNHCGRDLYVDASYHGDGSQSDENVNEVVQEHMRNHGVTESYAKEAKISSGDLYQYGSKVGTIRDYNPKQHEGYVTLDGIGIEEFGAMTSDFEVRVNGERIPNKWDGKHDYNLDLFGESRAKEISRPITDKEAMLMYNKPWKELTHDEKLIMHGIFADESRATPGFDTNCTDGEPHEPPAEMRIGGTNLMDTTCVKCGKTINQTGEGSGYWFTPEDHVEWDRAINNLDEYGNTIRESYAKENNGKYLFREELSGSVGADDDLDTIKEHLDKIKGGGYIFLNEHDQSPWIGLDLGILTSVYHTAGESYAKEDEDWIEKHYDRIKSDGLGILFKCKFCGELIEDYDTDAHLDIHGVSESRATDLKKEIRKQKEFINIASIENPMNMGDAEDKLNNLESELESLGGEELSFTETFGDYEVDCDCDKDPSCPKCKGKGTTTWTSSIYQGDEKANEYDVDADKEEWRQEKERKQRFRDYKDKYGLSEKPADEGDDDYWDPDYGKLTSKGNKKQSDHKKNITDSVHGWEGEGGHQDLDDTTEYPDDPEVKKKKKSTEAEYVDDSDNAGEKYICEDCDKEFSNDTALQEHQFSYYHGDYREDSDGEPLSPRNVMGGM